MISTLLAAAGLALAITLTGRGAAHLFDYWLEDTVIAISCSVVGAIVAARCPGNAMGWILCALGLLNAVRVFGAEYASLGILNAPGALPGDEMLAWVVAWSWVPLLGLFMFVVLLFPDGRPPGRGWRYFAWAGGSATLAGTAVVAFSPGNIDGLAPLTNPLGARPLSGAAEVVEVVMYAFALTALFSLFRRVRRANLQERLQLEWVAYAGMVAGAGAVLKYVVAEQVGSGIVSAAGYLLVVVGIAGIPAAMGLAILRYHLYNIDLVINRTLVYTALTTALALVYSVSVVLFQEAFRVLTGGESQLAIVASTLAIAFMFQPLRRRIQEIVDLRFYRRRYDARQALASLSSSLHRKTDLKTMTADLLATVDQTLQPSHASLWLRPVSGERLTPHRNAPERDR